MVRQSASVTVAVPLATVELRLQDITSWSSFLVGVNEVIKTSHERYLFRLDDGRELRVVVRARPREHLFTWRALGGVAYAGSLKLSAVSALSTRLVLRLATQPAGFMANLAAMIGSSASRAEIDLQRLDSVMHRRAS